MGIPRQSPDPGRATAAATASSTGRIAITTRRPSGLAYNFVGGYYNYAGPFDPWYWRWRPHYTAYYGDYYRHSYYGGIYWRTRPAPIYRPRIVVGAPGVYRPGAVVVAPGGGARARGGAAAVWAAGRGRRARRGRMRRGRGRASSSVRRVRMRRGRGRASSWGRRVRTRRRRIRSVSSVRRVRTRRRRIRSVRRRRRPVVVARRRLHAPAPRGRAVAAAVTIASTSFAMKRVLILHTGGTLGMSARRPSALQPDTYAHEIVSRVPELAALATIDTRILCNLDSSDVGPDEWSALADEVAAARAGHDGVVVIHGTDTMAYTAAALSFALVGLDKPVVLTGSQRPLGEIRSDARRNLVDAVDLATRDIPEVGVCFDGALLRGNRATKGDAWSYTAFASPNCPPLARLGLDVEIAPHVRRPAAAVRRRRALRRARGGGLRDAGDGPAHRRAARRGRGRRRRARRGAGGVRRGQRAVARRARWRRRCARLVDGGVTVAVVTQAHAGAVDLSLYANGVALRDAGAVAGGDMGIEAAVAKLMHALGRFPTTRAARAEYFARDVAGERGDGLLHLRD